MGFLLSLLPESFLWIGCLSVVLLVGVPHGALDIYLLWFEDQKTLSHFAKSIGKYICLVLCGLLFWRFSPELFWGSFFAAAIYHFGSSDEHLEVLTVITGKSLYKALWILSRGTVLVFAPVAFHPQKITTYLSQAAPIHFAQQISALAPFLCAYAGVFFLWGTFRCWKRAPLTSYRWILIKHLVSLLILILLFIVADPLLSFSLYFCCHHSLTHTFRVWGRIKKRISNHWLFFWGAVTTLCVIPVLWWVPKQMVLGSTPEGLVTASFVTIAALTFPHLLVVQDLHDSLRLRFGKSKAI